MLTQQETGGMAPNYFMPADVIYNNPKLTPLFKHENAKNKILSLVMLVCTIDTTVQYYLDSMGQLCTDAKPMNNSPNNTQCSAVILSFHRFL